MSAEISKTGSLMESDVDLIFFIKLFSLAVFMRLVVQPDVQCYGAVIKACANLADASGAELWVRQMRPGTGIAMSVL